MSGGEDGVARNNVVSPAPSSGNLPPPAIALEHVRMLEEQLMAFEAVNTGSERSSGSSVDSASEYTLEESRESGVEENRFILGLSARACAIGMLNARFDNREEEIKKQRKRDSQNRGQIRQFADKIVSHEHFGAVILTLIVLNSVTLALDSPDLKDNDTIQDFLYVSEFLFNGAFLLEAAAKLLAWGPFTKGVGYFRNGWNWLDFLIVVMGVLDVMLPLIADVDAANISGLRLLRILRPLRTLSRLKGMKTIVETLALSLPMIGDVFLLLLFLILVFAILGIQLWSTSIHQRCYVPFSTFYELFPDDFSFDMNDTITPSSSAFEAYFSAFYNDSVDPIFAHFEDQLYYDNQDLPYVVDPNDTQPCSTVFAGRSCLHNYTSCLSLGVTEQTRYINFDHMGSALLFVFKGVSLDDWPEDLWVLMDTYSAHVWIYFFFLVISSSYFAVNLFLAVLSAIFTRNNSPQSQQAAAYEEESEYVSSKVLKAKNKKKNEKGLTRRKSIANILRTGSGSQKSIKSQTRKSSGGLPNNDHINNHAFAVMDFLKLIQGSAQESKSISHHQTGTTTRTRTATNFSSTNPQSNTHLSRRLSTLPGGDSTQHDSTRPPDTARTVPISNKSASFVVTPEASVTSSKDDQFKTVISRGSDKETHQPLNTYTVLKRDTGVVILNGNFSSFGKTVKEKRKRRKTKRSKTMTQKYATRVDVEKGNRSLLSFTVDPNSFGFRDELFIKEEYKQYREKGENFFEDNSLLSIPHAEEDKPRSMLSFANTLSPTTHHNAAQHSRKNSQGSFRNFIRSRTASVMSGRSSYTVLSQLDEPDRDDDALWETVYDKTISKNRQSPIPRDRPQTCPPVDPNSAVNPNMLTVPDRSMIRKFSVATVGSSGGMRHTPSVFTVASVASGGSPVAMSCGSNQSSPKSIVYLDADVGASHPRIYTFSTASSPDKRSVSPGFAGRTVSPSPVLPDLIPNASLVVSIPDASEVIPSKKRTGTDTKRRCYRNGVCWKKKRDMSADSLSAPILQPGAPISAQWEICLDSTVSLLPAYVVAQQKPAASPASEDAGGEEEEEEEEDSDEGVHPYLSLAILRRRCECRKDVLSCRELCLREGYGGFTVFRSVAYFFTPAGEVCRSKLVDQYGTRTHLVTIWEEKVDMTIADYTEDMSPTHEMRMLASVAPKYPLQGSMRVEVDLNGPKPAGLAACLREGFQRGSGGFSVGPDGVARYVMQSSTLISRSLIRQRGSRVFVQRSSVSWRVEVKSLVENRIFEGTMLAVTIINVLALSADHHGIDESLLLVIKVVNAGCTVLFAAEIVLKVMGLGFAGMWADNYNKFDTVLVAVGVPQLLISFVSGGGGSNFFSVFRAARVLRLGRRWRRLRETIQTVMSSLAAVAYLSLLLLLFLFIYSILGMQLFGSTDGLKEQRENFSSLWRAHLTVFIVVTGEGWALIMKNTMRSAGWTAAVYFVSLFVIGRYIILNLFIAIIIEKFQDHGERTMQKRKRRKMLRKNSYTQGLAASEADYTAGDTQLSTFVTGEQLTYTTSESNVWSDDDDEGTLEEEEVPKQHPRVLESKVLRSALASNPPVAPPPPPLALSVIKGYNTTAFRSLEGWGNGDDPSTYSSTEGTPGTPTSRCTERVEEEGVEVLEGADVNADVASVGSHAQDFYHQNYLSCDLLPHLPRLPVCDTDADLCSVHSEVQEGSGLVYPTAARFSEASSFASSFEDAVEANTPTPFQQRRPNPLRNFELSASISADAIRDESPASPTTIHASNKLFVADLGRSIENLDVLETEEEDDETDAIALGDVDVSETVPAETEVEGEGVEVVEGHEISDPLQLPSNLRRESHLDADTPQHPQPLRRASPTVVIIDNNEDGRRPRGSPSISSPGMRTPRGEGNPRIGGASGAFFNFQNAKKRNSKSFFTLRRGKKEGSANSKPPMTPLSPNGASMGTTPDSLIVVEKPSDEGNNNSTNIITHTAIPLSKVASMEQSTCSATHISIPNREDTAPGTAISEDDCSEFTEEDTGPRWFGARTLCLFKAEGTTRRILTPVVTSDVCDQVVMILISLNLLVLCFSSPDMMDRIPEFFYWSDVVFTSLFFLEMCAKLVVFGGWYTKFAYVRDLWNLVDIVVVVTSVLGLFVSFFTIFRSFRVFRLITRSDNAKVVLYAAVGSVPSVLNGLSVCAFVFVLFAVLGVQLLQGTLVRCTNELVFTEEECNGTYLEYDGNNQPTVRDAEWVTLSTNYNNIFSAIFSLFKVAMSEEWVKIMFAAMDSVSATEGPRRDARPFFAVFFIAFYVMSAFLCLNLIISILISTFSVYHEARFIRRHVDEKVDKSERFGGWVADQQRYSKVRHVILTEGQKKWVRSQKLLATDVHFTAPPNGRLRRKIHQLVFTHSFEYVVSVVIGLNLLILCTQHRDQSATYDFVFETFNYVFIGFYSIECILKVLGLTWKGYTKDSWNRFDFVVLVVSYVGLAMGESLTFFRIFRIGRLLRLFHLSKGLSKMFTALLYALPPLFNIALLLSCIFFVYGILGVELYGRLDRDLNPDLGRNLNFSWLPAAVLALFQVSTGELWIKVLSGLRVQEPYCVEPDCGNEFSILYIVSFMVIVSFLMVNLFVAVTLEAFHDAEQVLDNNYIVEAFHTFRRNWLRLASDIKDDKTMAAAEGVNNKDSLPVDCFIQLLKETPPPIGPIFKTEAILLRYLAYLNIPVDKDLRVGYNDAVAAFQRKVYKISKEKALELAYLSQVTISTNTFTVAHVCYARKISEIWCKHLHERRLRAREDDERKLAAMSGDAPQLVLSTATTEGVIYEGDGEEEEEEEEEEAVEEDAEREDDGERFTPFTTVVLGSFSQAPVHLAQGANTSSALSIPPPSRGSSAKLPKRHTSGRELDRMSSHLSTTSSRHYL